MCVLSLLTAYLCGVFAGTTQCLYCEVEIYENGRIICDLCNLQKPDIMVHTKFFSIKPYKTWYKNAFHKILSVA